MSRQRKLHNFHLSSAATLDAGLPRHPDPGSAGECVPIHSHPPRGQIRAVLLMGGSGVMSLHGGGAVSREISQSGSEIPRDPGESGLRARRSLEASQARLALKASQARLTLNVSNSTDLAHTAGITLHPVQQTQQAQRTLQAARATHSPQASCASSTYTAHARKKRHWRTQKITTHWRRHAWRPWTRDQTLRLCVEKTHRVNRDAWRLQREAEQASHQPGYRGG